MQSQKLTVPGLDNIAAQSRGRMTSGMNFLKLLYADFRIDGRRVEFGMAEQLLDKTDVSAVFQHVRGTTVAQSMAATFSVG